MKQKEKNHQLSHFQFGEKDFEGLANPDKFLIKYKSKLNNAIMLGYLIHILTDRFYNEYIFKHFYIYDDNDNGVGIYLKGKKKILDGNARKNLKHRELYIYDKWLMNHNYVCKFHSFDCIEEVVDIDDASFDKERMRQYILSSNNDVDKLNIFSKFCFYNYKITTQKELDKIFNDCLEYIFKYIKENLKDV